MFIRKFSHAANTPGVKTGVFVATHNNAKGSALGDLDVSGEAEGSPKVGRWCGKKMVAMEPAFFSFRPPADQ